MNNLKELRKKSGLTLSEVADYFNTSVSAISLYETNKRKIPSSLLSNFASLYNCTIEDIIGDNPINPIELIQLQPIKVIDKAKDEMEQQLLERFRSLSFDDKLKAINYITNLTK